MVEVNSPWMRVTVYDPTYPRLALLGMSMLTLAVAAAWMLLWTDVVLPRVGFEKTTVGVLALISLFVMGDSHD